MLLELNVEPHITNNDEAFLAVNKVSDVILWNPDDVFIYNECINMIETNGVTVLRALYT